MTTSSNGQLQNSTPLRGFQKNLNNHLFYSTRLFQNLLAICWLIDTYFFTTLFPLHCPSLKILSLAFEKNIRFLAFIHNWTCIPFITKLKLFNFWKFYFNVKKEKSKFWGFHIQKILKSKHYYRWLDTNRVRWAETNRRHSRLMELANDSLKCSQTWKLTWFTNVSKGHAKTLHSLTNSCQWSGLNLEISIPSP